MFYLLSDSEIKHLKQLFAPKDLVSLYFKVLEEVVTIFSSERRLPLDFTKGIGSDTHLEPSVLEDETAYDVHEILKSDSKDAKISPQEKKSTFVLDIEHHKAKINEGMLPTFSGRNTVSVKQQHELDEQSKDMSSPHAVYLSTGELDDLPVALTNWTESMLSRLEHLKGILAKELLQTGMSRAEIESLVQGISSLESNLSSRSPVLSFPGNENTGPDEREFHKVDENASSTQDAASFQETPDTPVLEESNEEKIIENDDAVINEFHTAINNLQDIGRVVSKRSLVEQDYNTFCLLSIKVKDIADGPLAVLRAVMIQLFVSRIPILHLVGGADELSQKFEKWSRESNDWLQHWNLDNFERKEKKSPCDIFRECFLSLQLLEECIGDDNFSVRSLEEFVDDPLLNMKIIEAAKLLMMAAAIELFEQHNRMEVIPTFATLLFSREGTKTPEELMYNHFNLMGHSRQVEEMDLCLLGYSLKLTLAIVKPHHCDSQDFVNRYPECMIGIWPEVAVIAEGNGHYSIVIH